MKSHFNWQNWRTQNPLLFLGAGIAIALFSYYLIIVVPLNYAVTNLQSKLSAAENDILWMSRAAQEITRLKQESAVQREKTTESTFSLVNKRINEEGWKDLVTDVHQVEQNRVQVTFNSIGFNDLMIWLKKIFDKNGIFVLEATFQKSGPGKVQANLLLEGASSSSS